MNTTLKFVLLVGLLSLAHVAFGINVQITPSTFPCGTTTIAATTGCSFMGTMEVTVDGNPNGVTISSVSNVTNGNFTFVINVTAAAPASGQLNFRVLTSNDPTGCSFPNAIDNVAVTFNCTCNLQITATIQDESCFGCNNGSVFITISGNTSPTTYAWSNGATSASISGLTPSNYLLNIVDGNGCTFSGSYDIDAYICSPFTPSATVTDVICRDDCNGAIQLNALSNGSTSFTALWNEGQNTTSRTDLCAATYHVTVTDSDQCTASSSFNVDQPNEITITVDSVRNFTAVDSGAVFFTVQGLDPTESADCGCVCIPGHGCICGICGDFTFVNNLPPGEGFVVTITLNNGCQILSSPFTISNLTSIKDNANTPFKIFPNPTSEVLNVTTLDGSHPKEIVIKNTFGMIIGQYFNTNVIDVSNLPSGLYFANLYDEYHLYKQPFIVQH
jgi:hypothetical protein